MELRPRKGRSAQPLSTPSGVRPSPRKLAQSALRKKPASVPSSPILIPTDDEGTDPHHSRHDIVRSSPAVIHENEDDILLAETPLSTFVKPRRKASTSTIKQKKKAASTVKEKAAEIGLIAQQDAVMDMEGACMSKDGITIGLEVGRLDDNPLGDQIVAVDDAEATEPIKENVGSDSFGLDGKKIRSKCKKTESAKKNHAAKSGGASRKIVEGIQIGEVAHEVDGVREDQVNNQDSSLVADAPLMVSSNGCHLTLSLNLSEDSDMAVVGFESKDSASTLKKDVHAEASKATSKKKSRTKKDNCIEHSLNRKLFEESTSATLSATDIKPHEIIKHKIGTEASPRKETNEKTANTKEKVNSTCEAQCSIPSSKSSKEIEESNFELLENNEKSFGKADAKVAETNTSEEMSHRESFLESERVEEISRGLDDSLELKLDKMKGLARHIEDPYNTDDENDDIASTSSDEDEGKLTSMFASTMKAYLDISEPSVLSRFRTMQSEQDVQKGGESLSTKDVSKASQLNNVSRRADYGLSWLPKVALTASKNCQLRQIGSLEARPNKFWEKDQCLQDGLCVPPLDPVTLNKLARKQKKDTTGDKWYNLSAPTITPEVKKELQLVKLRGVLDPKRHYKAEDSKGLPKYFQIGTVVGGPSDFYSGRLTKKEQKNSLASELLSDSSLSAYRKRKYLEIQDHKQAGGKGFMKKKKSKRAPAWAKI